MAHMAGKRSYEDGCAAAHALDLIGERWALLVVRELMLGPKRFTDLRAGLPGISPNVLTQRLQELEQVSVVRRRKLEPPASSWVYELTEWGMELETVMMELGRWGARSPAKPRDAALSVTSLILSFRTMFDPAAAEGFAARYELRFGEDRFHAEIADGGIHIERGAAREPDGVIESDPDTLAALVYGDGDLAEALRAGKLGYQGDKAALKRLLKLFTLPAPASATWPAGKA